MSNEMNPQIASWHERIKSEKFDAITKFIKFELLNLSIYLIITVIFMAITHLNLTKPGLIIGCVIMITATAVMNIGWFKRSIVVIRYCNLYLTELEAVMNSSKILDYMFKEKLDNEPVASLIMSITMDHLMHIEKLDELIEDIEDILKEMDLDKMFSQMKQKAEFESEVCFEVLKNFLRFVEAAQKQ